MKRLAVIAIVCLALAHPGEAKNGAFKSTAHGDPNRGPARRKDAPRGSCVQCHDGHTSHRAPGMAAPASSSEASGSCEGCHALASERGGYPGASVWLQSTHGSSPQMLLSADRASRCSACHDPHGVRDRDGVIPAMLRAREPELCLSCHDGRTATDILRQMQKAHVHGREARGHHDPAERDDPARFGWQGQNRHASCSDCHGAHRAGPRRTSPNPPDASQRLAGVSRVEVVNGPAGTEPSYRWLPPDDPSPAREYEICFKCHSSWTRVGPGQPDLARLTNPANRSFHPIQAVGKNANIDPQAFTPSVSAESLLLCTDCHGSDDPSVEGVHGSSFEFLLKKRSPPRDNRVVPDRGDLCFACHTFEVYADATAAETIRKASRFAPGHTFHVGVQLFACAVCHDAHGSVRNPALIVSSGTISSYTQTPSGGSCTPSCHAARTYVASYRR